jgi:hypothetical protein
VADSFVPGDGRLREARSFRGWVMDGEEDVRALLAPRHLTHGPKPEVTIEEKPGPSRAASHAGGQSR